MPKLEDLTGKQIGKITVLKRGPNKIACDVRVQWKCLCTVCKNTFIVVARDLKRYNSLYEQGCNSCTYVNSNRFYE